MTGATPGGWPSDGAWWEVADSDPLEYSWQEHLDGVLRPGKANKQQVAQAKHAFYWGAMSVMYWLSGVWALEPDKLADAYDRLGRLAAVGNEKNRR